MKSLLFLLGTVALLISCASSRAPELQSFTLINVDLQKIDHKDFSEIEQIVNNTYAGGKEAFGNTSILKDEPTFLYLKVFSLSEDGACYRISIDRHRSKIVNMQPDCSIVVE